MEEKQLPCKKWISALTLWASCISCDNCGKKNWGRINVRDILLLAVCSHNFLWTGSLPLWPNLFTDPLFPEEKSEKGFFLRGGGSVAGYVWPNLTGLITLMFHIVLPAEVQVGLVPPSTGRDLVVLTRNLFPFLPDCFTCSVPFELSLLTMLL